MFCAVSALLRALTEEEAIAHACVSKSRYHEVKKHLLEIIVLPPKNGIGGKSKKRCWSLRENDRYDTIYGVSGNVQVSVRRKRKDKIVTKRDALNGKPYAGNPHARFEEGASASENTEAECSAPPNGQCQFPIGNCQHWN